MALEVTRLLDDPSSTPRQITEVIKADQAITSKILKLVNSPYYGIRGGVTTVEKAVTFLGYNTIFQLLIGVSVLEFSRLGGNAGLDVREFWKHSLGVAVASEVIGVRAGLAEPRELFAAGLKVGGALAERWRIPMALRAAISQHHQAYELRMQSVAKALQPQVDVVVLANAVCRRWEIGDGGDQVIPDIDKALVDRLGLTVVGLDQVKGEIARLVEKSKVFLDLLGEDV